MFAGDAPRFIESQRHGHRSLAPLLWLNVAAHAFLKVVK
jgi:hypothetical protein